MSCTIHQTFGTFTESAEDTVKLELVNCTVHQTFGTFIESAKDTVKFELVKFR